MTKAIIKNMLKNETETELCNTFTKAILAGFKHQYQVKQVADLPQNLKVKDLNMKVETDTFNYPFNGIEFTYSIKGGKPNQNDYFGHIYEHLAADNRHVAKDIHRQYDINIYNRTMTKHGRQTQVSHQPFTDNLDKNYNESFPFTIENERYYEDYEHDRNRQLKRFSKRVERTVNNALTNAHQQDKSSNSLSLDFSGLHDKLQQINPFQK